MNILQRLKKRWHDDGGYAEVLRIAFPLIISTGSWSVQHFVDRMFLTWYSPEAIAAAMPAGMVSFTVSCIFIGTASYVGTFVAQYYGAGRYDRCGPSLWQGIYVALCGGLLQMMLIPLAEPIFRFIGHAPEIQECERIYFVILCYGAAPFVIASALAAFYSGLGKTWPVMWVNIAVTVVNLSLDWLLIFGHGGFPKMGIAGAGIATTAAFFFSVAVYFVLILRPVYERRFHTLSGWRLEGELLWRLIRYGFPNGIHFFIEIGAFTAFIILIGKLGTDALAASNIAFNINTLAFMPMLGISIAVSVLVGQRLGENNPTLAEKSTYSAFHLTFIYMMVIALFYVAWPDLFIQPFAARSDPIRFTVIRKMTIVLLRFVAIYSLFDAMNIIFASAIKGAGDTRFVMIIEFILSMAVMVVPSYFVIIHFSLGIYGGWVCATTYIVFLGIAFYGRFYGGRWKDMRVIEERVISIPPRFPEAPTGE